MINDSLTIDEAMLNSIIKSLTNLTGDLLSVRDHLEKEQAWLDLLQAKKLQHFDTKKLLQMALKSRCYKVAEHLYELHRDYSNILVCYLKDSVRTGDVFSYILTYIDVPERCVKGQFLAQFQNLVAINCEKTTEIVLEHFQDFVEPLTDRLNCDRDLQYRFISELVNSDIKLPHRIAELFLEQLCVRDPNRVSDFVSTCVCGNEAALEITRKFGVGKVLHVLT